MPKMKTNSGAAKRFQVKKSGKIRMKKPNLRHNLSVGKSRKAKRHMRGDTYVHISDRKRVLAVMPYAQ